MTEFVWGTGEVGPSVRSTTYARSLQSLSNTLTSAGWLGTLDVAQHNTTPAASEATVRVTVATGITLTVEADSSRGVLLHSTKVLGDAVRQLASGEQHLAWLTLDGSVWTSGAGSEGQLGLGCDSAPRRPRALGPLAEGAPCLHAECVLGPSSPFSSVSREQFATVACGARHTCAVSRSGEVYTWGWGLYGQLGHDSTASVSLPTLVTALRGLPLVGIAAGMAHTVALSEAGDVYSWGWNADGQLGHGEDERALLQPRLVEGGALQGEAVVKVCCGARHTLAMAAGGKLFAWGWNKYGQLGLGGGAASFREPARVQLPGSCRRLVDVGAGWWHSWAVLA